MMGEIRRRKEEKRTGGGKMMTIPIRSSRLQSPPIFPKGKGKRWKDMVKNEQGEDYPPERVFSLCLIPEEKRKKRTETFSIFLNPRGGRRKKEKEMEDMNLF